MMLLWRRRKLHDLEPPLIHLAPLGPNRNSLPLSLLCSHWQELGGIAYLVLNDGLAIHKNKFRVIFLALFLLLFLRSCQILGLHFRLLARLHLQIIPNRL